MAFDPDAYLAGGAAVAEPPPFDPDAFLAGGKKEFNPDEFLAAPPKGVTPQGMMDTTRRVLDAFTGPGSLAQGNQIFDDAQRKGVLTDPEVQSFLNEKEASVGGDLKNLLQGSDPNALDKLQGEAGKFTNLDYAGKVNPQALMDFVKVHAPGPLQSLRNPEEVKIHPPGEENNPVLQLPYPTGDTTGAGVGRSISKQISGLTTPQNLAILAATAGAPAIVQKLVAVGFSATMAKDAAERISDLVENHDKMSPGEFAEKTTDAVGMAALSVLGIKHATGRAVAGGATAAERADSLTPEAADSAAVKNQLRTLTRGVDERGNLLPEKVYQGDAKSADPEALQGIALSYAKRVEQLKNASPEQKPAIQAELDSLDEQLQQFDRKEAFDAVAKARLPGEEAPPSNVTPFPKQPTPAVPTEAPPTPAESAGPTPPETSPPGDVTTPAPAVEIDPTIAKVVADSAERIADQVTQGQPTTVREAARDAALDNAMSSLRSGKQHSVKFMRLAAQEAAGKAAGKQGESLDAPVGESEATKLDTTPAPEPRTENTELHGPLKDALSGMKNPRDAQIVQDYHDYNPETGKKNSLEDVAKKHGLTPQGVKYVVEKSLKELRESLKERGFTKDEDYMGGGGPMGPIEAMEMRLARENISIKNADVNAMREREGSLRLMDEERKANPETWAKVEKHLDDNPDYGTELVDSIRNGEKKSLTDEEQAALIHELATVKNARDAAAERAADPTNDEATRAEERAKWQKWEDRLNETQQATKLAGTRAGRALQIRKMQISENFTYEGIARRERMVKGRGLTPEEDAAAKAKAEEIAKADEAVEKAQAKEEIAKENAEVEHTIVATIDYLGKEYLKKPSFSKQVLAVAKDIVKRWESEAETASVELKRQLGGESGAIGGSGNAPGKGRKIGQPVPENKSNIVVNAAKVIRAKLSRFALDKAEVLEQMVSEYGAGIKPHFNAAWNKAADLMRGEKAPSAVKEVLKKGQRKKGEKTEVEAVAAAKAEKVAGGKLTPKIVGDVVKAIINDRDIHETDPLMKAAHEALKEQFPDASERDVRRAFVDYGKKTYPSKEATNVEVAEQKQLVKIQEDIDREMEGLRGEIDPETGNLLGAEKQGFQRPKATQRVRELIKKRNEILRKRADSLPPSPEKLAGQQEAIKTRLKNAIEDTDKRLKTGLKAAEREPVKYNAENEQLAAELQAMRDKLKEVEEAENPGKSEADKQVDALVKVRDRLSDTLSGKRPPNAPADWNPLSAAADDLKAEITAMRELAAQLKRNAKPPTDPGAAAEKAQIRALEDSIRKYEDKISKNDFSTTGRKLGPDTAKVAALKEIRDARKSVYDAAKKAGKPILMPEERYNATRLKAIKKRIEVLEARKANDFTKPTKFSSPQLTRETLTAKAKADVLKREVDMGIKEQELKNRPLWKKALSQLNQVRGVILGSDIGVLTRQGLFSWARPVTAIKATANALKAAVSPEAMGRWEAEVRDREINGVAAEPLRKQAGLQMTDTMTHPEELVITRLLSRIPDFNVGGKTVRLSSVGKSLERFQTTFINSVRADLFDAAIKKGYSPEELKDRAGFINSVTGRSNVKHVPEWMQAVFTSPRYEVSRWETLAAPITNLGKLARTGITGSGVRGRLNRAAAANLRDITVTAAGALALFMVAQKVGGYQVNWNPTSSDFLKMRRGNDVWDVSAGLAPRLRDVMRLFVALTHPDYSHNIGKILTSSLLRTINPALKTPVDEGSIALQKLRHQTAKSPFDGFRTPDEQHGLITLAPLIVQSTLQALKEEGVGSALWTAAREFVGSSANRYPKPKE